jgi:hypothetical protein
MRENRLRLRLQQCESRAWLALTALDDLQEVLVQAGKPRAICDLTRVVGMISAVRRLLTGEEGGPRDANK